MPFVFCVLFYAIHVSTCNPLSISNDDQKCTVSRDARLMICAIDVIGIPIALHSKWDPQKLMNKWVAKTIFLNGTIQIIGKSI